MLKKPPEGRYEIYKGLSCKGCPLADRGTGFSLPDGCGRNGTLLVGEALGKNEALQGKPFVGASGYQLDSSLGRTNLKRGDFTLTNIIQCQPPGNWLEGAPWQYAATQYCKQYLHRVIERMKPKVIVPMGGIALHALLGLRGILDRRAPKRGYTYDVTIGGHSCFALPTIHPAHIIRGASNLTSVQIWDLQRAVSIAKERPIPYKPRYILDPSRTDIHRFRAEALEAIQTEGFWLGCDIETGHSRRKAEDKLDDLDDERAITRISFAFRGGHAITIPWRLPNLPEIQKLFDLPTKRLVVWNGKFDPPRLRDAGMSLPPIWDAMAAWHFLQSDLPKGLGFASPFFSPLAEWKSKGEESPEEYSCADSDAMMWNAYGIKGQLEKELV